MPIVSISRIQHRYGLSETIPQLSAAELGWVIDQRKLFIGNGPISEGAPSVGNTEILTEYSDILGVAQAYTYKGEAAGYTVQTGASASSPVTRSLQAKFDDMASVKDFGAKGDGLTDDTSAINRALFELFCREENPEVRRSLFFPAGVYIVSDVIKVPTYAMLRGEGQNCSIIKQTNASAACVARTADSLQQVGPNIGNNGAAIPHFIDLIDISFENATAGHVYIVNQAVNQRFHKVGFKGNITTPNSAGDQLNALTIYSTASYHTSNIVFEQCQFSNTNYGVVVDDDVHSVTFNGCKFIDLYKAIKLGELTSGSGSSVDGPTGFHITNNYFERIYAHGIHAFLVNNIFSSFNYYDDVGNSLAGIPATNCVLFQDDNCASIGDSFARTAAENDAVPRVALSNKNSFYLQPSEGFANGRRQQRPAIQITLADNTTSATTTGVTLDAVEEKGARIYYTASRGSNFRHGELVITASSAGATISDNYQYDGADLGLTFSLDVTGAVTDIRFVTTNTGADVTWTYGIEHMNH